MTPEEAATENIMSCVSGMLCQEGMCIDVDCQSGLRKDIFDIINAQRQAAVEEYKASLWQPIETAPKDGTWILVYGPQENSSGIRGSVEICSWKQYAWLVGWSQLQNGRYGVYIAATHWMPLPEPPKAQEGDAC